MAGNLNAFDPKEALSLLLRHKWLILLPTILVTGAAIAGSYFVTPRYQSSVVITMGNPVKLSNDLRRMLGEFGDASVAGRRARTDVRDYMRQIASPVYASQVLERMELGDDPALNVRAQNLAVTQPDMSLAEIKVMLLGWRLAKDIELDYVSSNHLELSAESKDPYEARDLAQTVGQVFVEEQARQDLQNIFLSLDFSFEQLARYEKELQDKLDEKTALEKEIDKWQSDNRIGTELNRNDLSSEIQRRTQEVGDLREEQQTLEGELNLFGTGKFAVEESPPLRRNKAQIEELVQSVASLVQEYAWDDPAISNAQLRAVRLEDEVEEEHQRLVDAKYSNLRASERAKITRLLNVRHRLDVVDRYIAALRSGLSDLEEKRSSLPEYRARLDEVEREVSVAESLRNRFRAQQQSFEISRSLIEQSEYRIIDQARVEGVPVWPDRRMVIAIGIMVGLFIGGFAVFAVEYSDHSLKNVTSVEEFLGYPVIGVVPRIAKTSKRL